MSQKYTNPTDFGQKNPLRKSGRATGFVPRRCRAVRCNLFILIRLRRVGKIAFKNKKDFHCHRSRGHPTQVMHRIRFPKLRLAPYQKRFAGLFFWRMTGTVHADNFYPKRFWINFKAQDF